MLKTKSRNLKSLVTNRVSSIQKKKLNQLTIKMMNLLPTPRSLTPDNNQQIPGVDSLRDTKVAGRST